MSEEQFYTKLGQDRRQIRSISWDDADGSSFSVGQSGVTKIEAYEEYGEQCMIPWLAVYRGDEVAARVPAHKVSVFYA